MTLESIRLPVELLCKILKHLCLKGLLISRFVSHDWNIASAMILTKVHPPINFEQRQDIGYFNSVMISSTLLPYSKFVFDPLTMHWRKRAVDGFISLARLTAKFLVFVPSRKHTRFEEAYDLTHLYDTKQYGQTLLRFITEFPNIVSFTIDCRNGFQFQQDELGRRNSLNFLHNLEFKFQYTNDNNEPMLLAALLNLAPRLRKLKISFASNNGVYKKHNTYFVIMDTLQRLKESVLLTLKMELVSECKRHFGDRIPFSILSSLEISIISIDVKGLCLRQWEESLWAVICRNFANLKSLSLQAFQADLSPSCFPTLEILNIRRKLESRFILNLNSAFENVRIFSAGNIHSAIFNDFLRNFKNLQELRMGCIAPNAWFGITGEQTKKCKESILGPGFEHTGASLSPFSGLRRLKLLHLGIIHYDCDENTRLKFESILGLIYISKNWSLRRLEHLILSRVELEQFTHSACSKLKNYHNVVFVLQ